jgi:hypothetical protein
MLYHIKADKCNTFALPNPWSDFLFSGKTLMYRGELPDSPQMAIEILIVFLYNFPTGDMTDVKNTNNRRQE